MHRSSVPCVSATIMEMNRNSIIREIKRTEYLLLERSHKKATE
ncbi:hypothetical protein WCN91_11785 [Pseudoalteromonas sp. YIC-827]|uniref:Transposase n=1 Tax=Pseudoalteromonas qingdaonensis TaxID=3131913 RepID=A0ABU9MXU7_9GAMM